MNNPTLCAADLQPGHIYKFNLKGKKGEQPYTFLQRIADGAYMFNQIGTGKPWLVSATTVTKYLVCEEPPVETAVIKTEQPVVENKFQNLSADGGEVGSIEPSLKEEEKQAALAEYQAVEKEAYDKADELVGEFQALMRRFNDELLPLVDRVQAFLSQRGSMHVYVKDVPGLPSWPEWRDAFLKGLQKKMKMSLATFKRRLKDYRELEDGGDVPEPDETDDAPAPVIIMESPKQLLTKGLRGIRKLAAKGDEQGVLVAVDNMQLAIDEGLLDEVEPRSQLPLPASTAALAPEPPATESMDTEENEDKEEAKRREVYPLTSLADYLQRIAEELACAWGLEEFATGIEAIAERMQDREVLNTRMLAIEKHAATLPEGVGISGRYLFKALRRDRRFQVDMRNIIKAGGTMYRGQKILGGDDPYIWRFTRDEIKAEMGLGGAKNVVKNRIGVFGHLTENDVEDDLYNQLGNKKAVGSEAAPLSDEEQEEEE